MVLFDGSQLVGVVRGGDVAPGVSTFGDVPKYESFGPASLNTDGEVAYTADLRGTSFLLDPLDPANEFDDLTLWRHDTPGTGNPTLLLREADLEPGGDGEFATFTIQAFNDAGGPVIHAFLRGTDGNHPGGRPILGETTRRHSRLFLLGLPY
ncbi:MAG: hypothetical protein HC900_08995 [Methylacidiphilales bacterium]|nr:hypothetical protein [Candidatus Methylacidiphilales bacterium]